jgi:hypothetical protein
MRAKFKCNDFFELQLDSGQSDPKITSYGRPCCLPETGAPRPAQDLSNTAALSGFPEQRRSFFSFVGLVTNIFTEDGFEEE